MLRQVKFAVHLRRKLWYAAYTKTDAWLLCVMAGRVVGNTERIIIQWMTFSTLSNRSYILRMCSDGDRFMHSVCFISKPHPCLSNWTASWTPHQEKVLNFSSWSNPRPLQPTYSSVILRRLRFCAEEKEGKSSGRSDGDRRVQVVNYVTTLCALEDFTLFWTGFFNLELCWISFHYRNWEKELQLS
jgi:hypothetical protein